jgi:His-Xaa-Ser system protein HxsD
MGYDCPRSDAEVSLDIDETIYDRLTVLRACYWYTEHCYVFVKRTAQGVLTVQLRQKEGSNNIQQIAGEFKNTLLDYELRRLIDLETGKIRELLVAKAVSACESSDGVQATATSGQEG